MRVGSVLGCGAEGLGRGGGFNRGQSTERACVPWLPRRKQANARTPRCCSRQDLGPSEMFAQSSAQSSPSPAGRRAGLVSSPGGLGIFSDAPCQQPHRPTLTRLLRLDILAERRAAPLGPQQRLAPRLGGPERAQRAAQRVPAGSPRRRLVSPQRGGHGGAGGRKEASTGEELWVQHLGTRAGAGFGVAGSHDEPLAGALVFVALMGAGGGCGEDAGGRAGR